MVSSMEVNASTSFMSSMVNSRPCWIFFPHEAMLLNNFLIVSWEIVVIKRRKENLKVWTEIILHNYETEALKLA